MKRVVNVIVIMVILDAIVGCEQIGSGSRSIAARKTARMSDYGIRAGKRLGFVIFTDIPLENTTASAGSTWTGHIKPAKGLTVNYEGECHGLEINGIEQKLSGGRIFLVATKGKTLSIERLNGPNGDGLFYAEIDRIA